MPVRTKKVFYGSVKYTGNIKYLLTDMVWVAFLIYIVEVEKVAEKSNLFITTLYLNYLGIYTRDVAKTNQMSKEESFYEYSWLSKAVNCFHKNTSSWILVCFSYTTVYILNI